MNKRDIVAPRLDGRLTKYRVYPDTTPPLVVDCQRALAAMASLGAFNRRYAWSIRGWQALVLLMLVGGLVATWWLPWWTMTPATGVAYAIHHAIPEVAADFVQQLVEEHPEVRTRLVLAGLVRADMPHETPTTPMEWSRNAWGSARRPSGEFRE